jgi:hypothetical protein
VRVNLLFSSQHRKPVRLGVDPYRDIVEAVRFYESMGRRPVRLDADDWVTLAEIGLRIGRSRELVRLWSTGEKGTGYFPPPLNPQRDTTFYSWHEVNQWLRRNNRAEAGDSQEPVLVALNLAIQLRRLLPRLSRPDVVLALAAPTLTRSWQRHLDHPAGTRWCSANPGIGGNRMA